MYQELKEAAYLANMTIARSGLIPVDSTWGNASQCDRQAGVMAIKPSGVDYSLLTVKDMVVVDLATGQVVEGRLRPSSDTPTHLELYRAFPEIGGVAHTHSRWATIFAQSRRDIPPYGTTHADTFYGAVPYVPALSREQVEGDYEGNTGRVMAAHCQNIYNQIPAALAAGHGPFTWGATAAKAVENAIILEECAAMAYYSIQMGAPVLEQYVLDKHYSRKHGPKAYYGQK